MAETHFADALHSIFFVGPSTSSLAERGQARDAGFFVFPDLSVRTEGTYRLKLTLFEVIGANVHHCKSIFSAPFYVYTAKKFPGMEGEYMLLYIPPNLSLPLPFLLLVLCSYGLENWVDLRYECRATFS